MSIEINSKNIKQALKIVQEERATTIFAVVISNNDAENNFLEIAMVSGEPITHEVFNYVRDSYHVRRVDYKMIGTIPVRYSLEMDNMYWKVDVPLPFSVIKRHMSKQEYRGYLTWLRQYDHHTVRFLQRSERCLF